MTNLEIYSLLVALQQVGNLSGAKFSYAVARNINLLSPKIKEYEANRIALLESMAKKGKDKKPIMEDIKDQPGQKKYVLEDETLFNTELKKLQEEDAGDVKLFMLNVADLPQAITAQQTTGIISIIKDETKNGK